jgi:hypothetical protein
MGFGVISRSNAELAVETGLNLQRIHQFLYNSEFALAGNASVVQNCIIVGLQLLDSIVSNVQKFTSVSSAAALETQTDGSIFLHCFV